MRLKKMVCLLLAVLFTLGFTSAGFAWMEDRPDTVFVEIVPLGIYPDSALPPGKAVCESEVNLNTYGTRRYTSFATLDAWANPGWVFLGWLLSPRNSHEEELLAPEKVKQSQPNHWTVSSFEYFEAITAKAVFTYVGDNPAFNTADKKETAAEPSADKKESYEVGVYERDSRGRDGDYGTLFSYPHPFNKDMTAPDGSTILLAAWPYSGYQFNHWLVFKEAKDGKMSRGEKMNANVLFLLLDAHYSIDAIFSKLMKR